MSSNPARPAIDTRLARMYVDECRARIWATAERLGVPRCGLELQAALHESVSVLLRREVVRLTRHDPEPHPLPVELHTEIGRWKAALGPEQLKGLLEQRAFQWHRALTELLFRLDRDWSDLVESLGVRSDAKLTSISTPLGDPHNGGRSVYKVGFDDGLALVYKPRSVDGESTFGRVVEWLRQSGCEPTLTYCRTLARAGYGWTRYVKREYCTTVQEASAYYERQGAFLALFFFLGGSDCIADNVVVAREHPVWVDLECLCGPKGPWTTFPASLPSWMAESVLSTGLVFCAKGNGAHPRRGTGLSVSCRADRALVFTDDGILRDVFVEAVERGFGGVYAWVLARKEKWLSAHGPLSWWWNQSLRLLPRDTALYVALSDALKVVPAHHRASLCREVEAVLRRGQNSPSWMDQCIPAEIRALDRGDVPYWMIPVHSRAMREADGTPVHGVVQRSGLESLSERVRRMSTTDAEAQKWLIGNFLRLQVRT